MRKTFALLLLACLLLSHGATALAFSWSDLCPWIMSRNAISKTMSLSAMSDAELKKTAGLACNPRLACLGCLQVCDAALMEIRKRQADGAWPKGWKLTRQ